MYVRVRLLRQMQEFIQMMPFWAQVLMGLLLLAVSGVMVYGRMNTSFGKKVFTKIPEKEIRTNVLHIVEYTVLPVAFTILYFFLMFNK